MKIINSFILGCMVALPFVAPEILAQSPYEHGKLYLKAEGELVMAIKVPDSASEDFLIAAFSEGLERTYRRFDVVDYIPPDTRGVERWVMVKLDYTCTQQSRLQPVWVKLSIPPCANCGVTLWAEKPVGEVSCGRSHAATH